MVDIHQGGKGAIGGELSRFSGGWCVIAVEGVGKGKGEGGGGEFSWEGRWGEPVGVRGKVCICPETLLGDFRKGGGKK